MRSLLLLTFLACMLTAAPVPKAKPRVVAPGKYLMLWGGNTYEVVLEANGAYTAALPGGTRYWGSWGFCPKSRIIVVCEQCEMSNGWFTWTAPLDPWTLSGHIHGSSAFTQFRSK